MIKVSNWTGPRKISKKNTSKLAANNNQFTQGKCFEGRLSRNGIIHAPFLADILLSILIIHWINYRFISLVNSVPYIVTNCPRSADALTDLMG